MLAITTFLTSRTVLSLTSGLCQFSIFVSFFSCCIGFYKCQVFCFVIVKEELIALILAVNLEVLRKNQDIVALVSPAKHLQFVCSDYRLENLIAERVREGVLRHQFLVICGEPGPFLRCCRLLGVRFHLSYVVLNCETSICGQRRLLALSELSQLGLTIFRTSPFCSLSFAELVLIKFY